jgi:hypothetical protein
MFRIAARVGDTRACRLVEPSDEVTVFPQRRNAMSVEDYAKPHSGTVTDTNQKQPPASVDDGSLADEAKKGKNSRKKRSRTNPIRKRSSTLGYFKDGGSL